MLRPKRNGCRRAESFRSLDLEHSTLFVYFYRSSWAHPSQRELFKGPVEKTIPLPLSLSGLHLSYSGRQVSIKKSQISQLGSYFVVRGYDLAGQAR